MSNATSGVFPIPVGPAISTSKASGSTTLNGAGNQKARVDHRTTDEAALVRRVQAQDELAFREIMDRYQTKVYSIIYGILRNHNDAEDIAQQVFAKVYFSITQLRFPEFSAYLDLQDHGERVLRLPAKEESPQAGVRERFTEEDSLKMENSASAVDRGRRARMKTWRSVT